MDEEEDTVVYADDDRREKRQAQELRQGQNTRVYVGRSYAQLQQQLQSTRAAALSTMLQAEEEPISRRSEGLLGDNAKVNLQQQFERSVAADKGAFSLQPITVWEPPDRGHNQALSAHKDAPSQRLLPGSATADKQTVSSAEVADRPESSMFPARQQDINAAPSRQSLRGHPFGGSHAQTASPPQQKPMAGTQGRQMLHNTGRKGVSSAKFAIREPQPAGLSLRAGLQQLRGAAGSSQMQGGGGWPTEDAILIEAEDEQASMATPAPSSSRAALLTHSPAQGEEQDNPKPGGGMSAQRNFLASVLRPGKRQQPSTVQQVPKRAGRAVGMNGPLTGPLHSIMQQEELLSARGNGKAFLQVQLTEREQQGNIVTCRCHVLSGPAAGVSKIVLFRSDMAVDTHIGSTITICSPWRECGIAGTTDPVIFALAAHNGISD